MGVTDNQIRERQEAERQLMSDSLLKAAGVVLGKESTERKIDDRVAASDAIGRIMRYYRYKTMNAPESMTDLYEQLDYCLRPHGVMYREVQLDKRWYRKSFGPILAFTKEDDTPVALIPGKVGGYWYKDDDTGLFVRVSALTVGRFAEDALCFYRPLPQKKLGVGDLIHYMWQCVSLGDIAVKGAAALGVTLVGLLMPTLVSILTGPVLASGEIRALVGIAICIACAAISQQLIRTTVELLSSRIQTKATLGVEASVMMRLLSLPTNFFKDYSPGELKSRFMSVNSLCSLLLSLVTTAGISSIASLLYVTQIVAFAPALVIPALLAILVTVGVSAVTSVVSITVNRRRMEAAAAESGASYAVISGIRKIRLAGAEKRIFAKWLDAYTRLADLTYNPPLIMKVSGVISLGVSLVSNIVLYYLAVRSGVDQPSYFAFTTAYGMIMGAFVALSETLTQAASVQPMLRMAEPFLEAVPETNADKEVVTDIHGNVRFEHVAFRYDDGLPLVLDDLSLDIQAGEYVAIVGKSGCGKSTLIRLLLGFEKPAHGRVSVDGKNLERVDLPSLRRRIGTVMQHDGLFQGSIYYNIAITAPEIGVEEAWEAAEAAGIADDIRELPMGMHTLISEGQGGISGGQKQRLMIARAIAPKPKLLIFDEATSALDNKTQRQVTDALDRMDCTRIVVAHRLSTIKHCDRILVLDGGHIAEDGTYEELIEKDGLFAELVARQRVNLG